ncbi:DnaB-like helicase C-terminal domain-containing protein [Candidatus Vondammii sp. HM_W22]|uniref:DnaB-like helicase C-terminal domain-containing protein n=1 Tax=Candidatus Vondammii sp. HM_W22 TaxID=2687299 RepID=UPI002E7B4161|nr:DnaB-like helicase C-terminal domain-containing protein [Candidatus Vondammii sp. HM_W22]
MKKLTSKDKDFIEFLGRQESQYLMTKDTWRDGVIDIFSGNVVALGDFLPWSKTHQAVRLRPGEVSVWAGINGHGKSMVTGQVALWLSRHSRVCIASLEMKPEATLTRMVRQASGLHNPSEECIRRFFAYETDKIWIYDQLDTVQVDRLIGMLHYSAQKLSVKHIFIDSLMKCGIGTDDYNGQKDFVDRLCWVAKSENIHIHLIHHMRKGDKETHRPGKFDVRGASEIVDLVDNLFIVFRNKVKEEKIRQKKEVDSDDPDTVLTVAKQRHGEWEGSIKLWFHPPSQQFVPYEGAGAIPWPNPD